MKKLLMMAVAACVATFAQALTINWNAGLGNLTETAFAAKTGVMLVYSSTETNVANIAAAINAGTLTSIATEDGTVTIVDGTYVDAEVSIADTNKFSTGSYFFVVADGNDFYVSTLAADAAKWYEVPKFPGASQGSDFTKVTVPEPTALALLALGVAGVALRRRRRA